ncbi:MAG: M48 family metallopeptidase [Myxococcaceae bacterium]
MRFRLALLPLFALTFAAGCASTPIRAAEKVAAEVLVSDEQEQQLGLQVHQELQKEGMKLVTDSEVNSYVDQLARPILRAANNERRGVKWKLYVVDDPKMVNAFATPGGNLYVYTGLILASENEAQLAGVLAHEAGHVTGRHAARNLVQQYGLQGVASLALGKNPSQVKQLAATLVASGSMLAHSRSQEHEADEYGARFSRGAGFDPNGLIGFFRILQRQEGGSTPKVLTWFSTHPATSDRISHLQQYIAENRLRGGATSTLNRLAAVQQRLK